MAGDEDDAPERPKLSFEKQFRRGLLPTKHISKSGKATPYHELTEQHLYMAWSWFFNNAYQSPGYMALQREKERRKRGLPVLAPEDHPHPPIVICVDCGAEMVLRSGKFGMFFGCVKFPECRGTHKCDEFGAPIGEMTTRAVKDARIRAHAMFDRLWKKEDLGKPGHMKRTVAYQWLQDAMGVGRDDAHIAKFNQEQCERLLVLVGEHLINAHLKGKP